MPFLKAPLFNDYKLADDNSRIILKPVLSTFQKCIFLLIYCFTGTVYSLLKTLAILISLGRSKFAVLKITLTRHVMIYHLI